MICVREEENRFLEGGDLIVHFVRLDMRLELRKVVYSTLAVGCSNHVRRVLPDVCGYFAPCSLDSLDGVGQSTVLEGNSSVSIVILEHTSDKVSSYHVEENGITVEGHSLGLGRHCDFIGRCRRGRWKQTNGW